MRKPHRFLAALFLLAPAAHGATVTDDMVACRDKGEIFNLAMTVQRDGNDAFMRQLNRLVKSGECQVLGAGESVLIDQRGFGVRCVSRVGEHVCWWINEVVIRE